MLERLFSPKKACWCIALSSGKPVRRAVRVVTAPVYGVS